VSKDLPFAGMTLTLGPVGNVAQLFKANNKSNGAILYENLIALSSTILENLPVSTILRGV
jgi:hypothetical protein